jgi:SAM-dependent methyltransferase
MGGGTERVLYSIARHIQQLIVTDLYDKRTDWDCARTIDPVQFIKENKPFEVGDHKIKPLRMDMRQLEFEDNTFDFCYSSCAIEHIGDYDDFLRHLNEVDRVLKEDGIYVLTTEFHFGEETITDQNNYIFAADYLNELISSTDLTINAEPDCSITPQTINYPFPVNMGNLCYSAEQGLSKPIADAFPHVLLLRGKYPFTSILLILKKETNRKNKNEIVFQGLEESCRFLESGIAEYHRWLEEFTLSLDPFSGLAELHSFANHAKFFTINGDSPDDNTVFHTDYIWMGTGERQFTITLFANEIIPSQKCTLQLRIHRYATLSSSKVECIKEVIIQVNENSRISETITIPVQEDHCYAVLGKLIGGKCRFSGVEIISRRKTIRKATRE